MSDQNNKSPFTILFVDDEEKTRKYFERGLRDQFNVITAENIEEAEKIVKEKHAEIAVVITDQRMPGGNGVKLLNFLYENYPRIIRLLTTGYSDLSEAIEAVNKGEIFRYIQKPWDYHLLKTELKQALNLFELRLERDKLVGEKIFVRQKMVKIDRLRLLIVLARALNFIRFADVSMMNFIKQFVNQPKQHSDSDEWQIFELGNQEFLETLLSIDLLENIYAVIPNSQNYDFNNSINSKNIKDLLEAESTIIGGNIKITIADQLPDLEVNNYAFHMIIKKLLSQISATSASSANLDIKGSEDNKNLLMNLNLADGSWPNDNIFTTSPGKLKTSWHVDLLICYLLIGHHGGSIEAVEQGNKIINYNIKLPFVPQQTQLPGKLSDKELDNIIFSAMIN